MKKVKKWFASLSLLLCLAVMATACGSSSKTSESTAGTTEKAAVSTTTSAPAEVVPIKFYGLVKEFNDGEAMIQKMQELLPNYKIEAIAVDWSNLVKVVSTGIASGDPCDVYAMWPAAMKGYVDAGQALDLTPYLDENNGEWRNQMSSGSLELGTYDGKVYNVSYQLTYSCMFVNKDAFTKAGITVNPNWTWDEFATDLDALKKSGIATPFCTFNEAMRLIFEFPFDDLINNAGKMEDAKAGKYSLNGQDASKALTAVKTLFDSGLWYGGKGGLNVSRDEAQVAFIQGKTAVLCESAAVYSTLAEKCDFDVVPVLYPNMLNDPTKAEVHGGGDGLFVPSNSAHPKEAAECIKVFTGNEVQKIHADAGFVVCNVNTSPTDPTVLDLVKLTKNINSTGDFQNIASSKITDYMNNQLIPKVLLSNSPVAEALNGFDEVRQQALKEAEKSSGN